VRFFAGREHPTGVRYVVAAAVVVALGGGLAGVKVKQISSLMRMGRAMAQAGPPAEAVSTAKAMEQRWEGTLTTVGSLAPAKGVTVSSEAAGLVTAIRFESGARARQGQVLVELDTSVERAQLASATARQELTAASASRSRALIRDGVISGAQHDSDEAALKSASAEVAALRAQIARKTVRAPFAGRLGIRLVNVGQYLNPGTPVTDLQAVDLLYVDFTLPQHHLARLTTGMAVRVTLDGQPAPVTGSISAINPTLDPATRAIRLRATLGAPGSRLRPGMFARVEVRLGTTATQVVVPATAVVHAPYGDSVYVVEERRGAAGPVPARPDAAPPRIARQQFVRLGEERGDFVAVLDGVSAGQEVVAAGAFKLRNGAAVVVHDAVGPAPRLDPRPENR
jgi:membrane fusion protein (multidrug efflux system)